MEQLGLDLTGALAGAADGAIVVGREGRILAWNRAAERILGYRAGEVIGRPCCEVLAGRDAGGGRICEPDCRVMLMAHGGRAAESFDMRALTKARRPVWLNVSTLTARCAGRTFVAHLFRNVTATRELREPVEPEPAKVPGEPPDSSLTPRELQVIGLLARGMGTREMADRLQVSRATIRNHVQSILGKLGVHSRLEAVARVSGRQFIARLTTGAAALWALSPVISA
ncbi:MAG TPA: PAS and helix-turn-helix domain-containing protein [Methylomirabilota bacterium]|nr:PAS and helix-turn-helix domain-containing protein [Methylomirabilota bacterium]